MTGSQYSMKTEEGHWEGIPGWMCVERWSIHCWRGSQVEGGGRMVALSSRRGRVVRRGTLLHGDADAVVIGRQQHLRTARRSGNQRRIDARSLFISLFKGIFDVTLETDVQ